MRTRIVLLAVGGLLVAGLAGLPARASSQTDAVETRLLGLINQGRGGAGERAEVMHAGLRHVAREHSADMSARDSMDHNGYPDRINRAEPDPAQGSGPPDKGFTGASCENVAWYQPAGSASTEEVAQKFYTLWDNSSTHHECMFDSYGYGLNVAGVGIYYDESTNRWWATFDSARDSTPPDGTTGSPAATPEPTPAPTPTPTPTPRRSLLPPR